MKQILTMGAALFLCAVLFFILKPLANEPDKEDAEPAAQQAAPETVDKIGEFPIRPAQRQKLEMIQKERQRSIQGMVPEQLSIPSLSLIADIQPTGVLENGEMGVPDDVDEAGWFQPGFKAGAKGNAVLAGHVDSLTGPAIFYELDTLKIGDTIELSGADERLMIFKVNELTSYETDAAPIEEIFGKSDKRMLNLITCTGDFNRDIAEEALQEVFIKLWRGNGEYDESKGKFPSWLFRMAQNTAVDLIRKRKEPSVPLDEIGDLASTQTTVEDLAEWQEKKTEIETAVKDLSTEQQNMIHLFYFKGYTHESIAEQCNIPLGTVKSRIRLALKKLKKSLQERGAGNDEYEM